MAPVDGIEADASGSRIAEVPRKLSRGPRITITCECGQRRALRYGERWSCEGCGRTWNTRRIPADEYAAIRRTQLRFRWTQIGVLTLAVAVVAISIAIGSAFGGLILVAFGAITWKTAVWPRQRRRYLEAVAKLPTWEIKPD
jgi:hypothetical protein